MPDELCRICGGTLANYSLCSECRKPIKRICTDCGGITDEWVHNYCFYQIEACQTRYGMERNIISYS